MRTRRLPSRRHHLGLVAIGIVAFHAAPLQGQEVSLDDLVAAAGPEASSEPRPEVTAPPGDVEEETAAPPSAASRRRVVEEIIVTAQKSEQALQDVPISISVLDGEFIEQQSITDYRDLALYVPNAHVDPGNGLFPDINVRGYGSALTNKAFEQSVGLVIDGVPYGRSGYFQGPLFDVDRVELLRGPQGTLFGKNTTAGLLNVITRKPTDEYTGSIDLELGELDRRRVEGAVGGPLITNLVNFRVSGLSDERDGLVENTTARVVPGANETMNRRDRKAMRIQLGFPDLYGARFDVSYEKVDLDFYGIGWELDRVPEQTKSFYRRYDPDVDFIRDNFVGSVDTVEFNNNDIDTVVGNLGYSLGSWALDVVGGYSLLTVRSLIDDDFGPQPQIFNTSLDDDPQYTGEVRIASPSLPGFLGLGELLGIPLGRSNVLTGFFFQRRDLLDSELAINFNLPVLAQFAAANNSPPGTPLAPLEDFVGTNVPIGGLGRFDTTGTHEETTMFFDQKTKSFAGFAHIDWQLLERWTLQYGMRFTQEEKEARWNRVVSEGTGALFEALGGESEFTAGRSRSEFAFTPKVSLRWDWTDEVNFYASWGKGSKAGGFNEQVFNTTDESLEFQTEKATAWEVGSKARLLGGAATVNANLFRHDVSDFQVLTLPPNSVATTVVNAGEARAQGLELDATWLPASWLTLFGTVAFNDSEFLSFVFGQCSFDRSDTDGNGDGRCDVTGEPLFRTPKWKTTLVGSVRYPLRSIPGLSRLPLLSTEGIDLMGGGSLEYQDVQYLERTFDERVRQSPFFRLGANIGLGSLDRGWSFRLHVENLTDEATDVLIRDVPLGGGNFAAIPEPPRLIFGTLRWSF